MHPTKQRQILEAIEAFTAKNGIQPTKPQVVLLVGSTRQNVYKAIAALRARGFFKKTGKGIKSLKLVDNWKEIKL